MVARTNPQTREFAIAQRRQLTDAECLLWWRLRGGQLEGARFRRQVPIGSYTIDFACLRPKIAIELDGGQHSEALQYDADRSAFLERQGFRVLRFWNPEAFQSLEDVLRTIWHAVNDARRRT